MYLSIIIPFYNEEENLQILVDELNKVLLSIDKSVEVIFIDDGSTDNSLNVLKNVISGYNNWQIIKFAKNQGQTAAWAAGIGKSVGEIVVFLDSDLENDPADIPVLLEKIEQGYDLVSGWRKNRWQGQFLKRRLTSLVANWLISKISGVNLHDFGCSLKAYRSDVIKNIKLRNGMHRFIAVLAVWQGIKFKEVEVKFAPRKFGLSKYGIERIITVLIGLMVIKFLNHFSRQSIYF